jgi:hypothetical protein
MKPSEIFAHWERVRDELIATVETFEERERNHVPFEGCRKVGDIMLPIADAEDGWLRFGITKELGDWPDQYVLENYPDKKSILKVLGEVHQRTTACICPRFPNRTCCRVSRPPGG